MRFFNTAGPMQSDIHYQINPLERWDLDEILQLIDTRKYFVLHAPRQTGKTSAMLALMDYINKEDKYTALYANIEASQGAREDVERGIRAVLAEIASRMKVHLKSNLLYNNWISIFNDFGADKALTELLKFWSANNDKPVILLLDEVDALIGDTLISLLRQLRSGYDNRPANFPQSVILCGVRDVRDYRIHSAREKTIITGGSAFNIKAKSLRLGNFDKNDIKQLLNEHTKETKQKFEDGIIEQIWKYSGGQPWLVNALAYELTYEIKANRDRSITITKQHLIKAKENLILRRDTHLDQLVDKLKEQRVKNVIHPILSNSENANDIPTDDIQYCIDLGLIIKDKHIKIANEIYKEIIPRELTLGTQLTITHEHEWYINNDGSLNMIKLIEAFQLFFRKNFEHWIKGFNYQEAGPQLLLQAFLQRIINGGGSIDREYGLGRKRTDLYIKWNTNNKVQEFVIELKIKYNALEKTIEDGLQQTHEYMDKCGTNNGHLIIFDQTKKKSWDDKIFQKDKQYNGKIIHVWGM